MLQRSPLANLNFACVLIAGGHSTRMGRDKALLEMGGELLWQRQMKRLRSLQAAEVFVSARPGAEFSGEELVPDRLPNRGPLGGLEAALHRTGAEWLVALAVDLPMMTSGYLALLLQKVAETGRGIIPQNGRFLEPLAAVYPRAALPVVTAAIESGEFSLQACAQRLIAAELMRPHPVTSDETPLFLNLNTPQDLSGL